MYEIEKKGKALFLRDFGVLSSILCVSVTFQEQVKQL